MRSRIDVVENCRERSLVVEVPYGMSTTPRSDPDVQKYANIAIFEYLYSDTS